MAFLKFTGNQAGTGTVTLSAPDTNNNYTVVMPAASGRLVVAQDLTTANIAEGTNLYFTTARARSAISVTGTGSYDANTGVITISGPVTSVNGATGAVTISNNITTAAMFEHSNQVSANYAITANNNAVSAGPITIQAGVLVTVPDQSTWTVV